MERVRVEVKKASYLYDKRTGHRDRVIVRRAAGADAEYVRGLSNKVFHQHGPYEEIVGGWFDSRSTLTILAFMEKRPVGFAMVSQLAREWYSLRVFELLAIAVEPAKWRRGIGNLLMSEIERKIKVLGVKTLILHTGVDNLAGRKLFEKCGFMTFKIKKEFYPEGQDALMMYKDIG